jgi:hypothetical protein
MAQVILLEENEVLNELITINLTSVLGVDVVNRKNATAVLSLLEILPEIDLVITQYEMGGENAAYVIQEYIETHHLEIGLIVLGGPNTMDNEFTATIINPKDWEKVVEFSAKILGLTPAILTKQIIPEYVPIPINYFFNLEAVNCDVFIRIKKTPTDFQFVKRIHNGDAFTKDVISRYKSQGLDNFYISSENRKNFTTYLSNILVDKLESTSEITERIELMGESYEIAAKEIISLGFTSEVVQLTDTIINNMIKNVEQTPEMNHLLHKVINANTPLAFQRCHMTSVIASECLKNLKLATPQNILAITFASFFHDITLVDHFELSKLNSDEEAIFANLSTEENNLVQNHAYYASRLVDTYPIIPSGVEKLIIEHHGTTHGLGFSIDIESFSTISKVFIIAHDFVLEIIKYKENKTVPRSLSENMYKRFPTPTCTKIIKALEQSLIKNKSV